MLPHEILIESHSVYSGKIINVRRDTVALPGGESVREIVEHRGGVAVAALDGEGNIYMVRQYRYAFGEELLEIPAGKLEPGEDDHTAAALRELREETGLIPSHIREAGVVYPSVGFLTERLYIYIASGLTLSEPSPDGDEYLEVLKIPLAAAAGMVLRGEIRDAKTICALFLIANNTDPLVSEV